MIETARNLLSTMVATESLLQWQKMKMQLSGSMLTKYHQIVTTAETLHPHRRGQNHYQNIVQCHSKCQSVSLSHEMKQQAVSCCEGGRIRYNVIRARASICPYASFCPGAPWQTAGGRRWPWWHCIHRNSGELILQ